MEEIYGSRFRLSRWHVASDKIQVRKIKTYEYSGCKGGEEIRDRYELYECQQSGKQAKGKYEAGLDWQADKKQDTRYRWQATSDTLLGD